MFDEISTKNTFSTGEFIHMVLINNCLTVYIYSDRGDSRKC